MSALGAVWGWFTAPDATQVAGNVAKLAKERALLTGDVPTLAQVEKAFKALQAFPYAHVEAALKAKLGNIPADFVALEDFEKALADIGVPYAGDALLATKVLAFVVSVVGVPGPFIVPGPDFQTPMHTPGRGGI